MFDNSTKTFSLLLGGGGRYRSLANFKIFIPLLVFVCVIGLSFNDSVFAQSYTGVLDLDYISSTAYSGDKITFSGYLTTTSGHVVPNAKIKIKDNVSFGSDTTIKTLTTNNNGYFSGTWTAKVRSSGAWDFYAVFDGSSNVKKDRSETYNVKVYPSSRSSSSSSSSSDNSYSDVTYTSVLVLNHIPSTAISGDKITFSGRLTTTSGHVLPNAKIWIMDDVRLGSDTAIKTLYTDSRGYFSGTWTAQVRDSGKWDFYAQYYGSSNVEKDRSTTYNVKVNSKEIYTSVLVLDYISPTASPGDKITFSGRLTTTSGHVLPNAKIWIMDDVRLGSDTAIKTLTTDSRGYFSGTWTAQVRDSGKWDFYAQYHGSSNVKKDRSITYNVQVSNPSTSITFYKIPSSIYVGETITFTGKLETNGRSLPNALIKLYDDDPLSPDDKLASGYTDSSGRFTIAWEATQGLLEKDFDIYAVFDGNSNYKRDRSPNQEITILKYSSSITLDPLPASARLGERITFSGTLNLDLQNPQNSVVYIKDDDTAGRDDLLTTAFVKNDGRFSTTWFVTEVDFIGRDAEIFAVYEGNKFTDRAATAITKLSLSDPLPSLPPTPSNNEYMKLYYSLPFYKNPLVSIVLDPDSPNRVERHIVPVKEGILMAASQLQQKYGGSWNVDFYEIRPGDKSKPGTDIIINLITSEHDSRCNDWWGWASVHSENNRPIPTSVCSDYSNAPRDDAGVSATAMHEFIHAIGLGHTFYGINDLMCSVDSQSGQPTCPDLITPKRKDLSNLNLEAITELYGSDGFLSPNYEIIRNTLFSLNNFDNWDDSNSVIQTTPTTIKTTPTTTSCTTSIADYDYQINDLILKSNYHMPYTICDPGDISFRFSSSYSTDGFIVYVLPPETNVADFVYRADGKYYTCEEYKKTWHKKGNTCNVRVGSHIVLHNPEDHAITINGWIKN